MREEPEALEPAVMLAGNPAFCTKEGKPLPADEVAALKGSLIKPCETVRDFTEWLRKMMDEEFGAELQQNYESAVYDETNEEMDKEKDIEDLMVDELEGVVRSAIMKKYMVEKEECPFWYGVPCLAMVANMETSGYNTCRILRQVPEEDVVFYQRFENEGKFYDMHDAYAKAEIAELVGATMDDGSGKSFAERYDKEEMESYIKNFCEKNAVKKKKDSKDGANGNGDGGEGGTPEDEGDGKKKKSAKTKTATRSKDKKDSKSADKKNKLAGGATRDGANTKSLMTDHGHTFWEVEYGVLQGKRQICKFENILLDRKVVDTATFTKNHGGSLQVKIEAAYKRVKAKARYPTDIVVSCLFGEGHESCAYPEYPTGQGWCEACVKEVKPNPNEKKMIFSGLKMTNLKANKLAKEMCAETGEALSSNLKINSNFGKNVANVRGH